ncbi:class 1 fructose-bisphosphatase [Gilvimarinus agarilyticus]|uniref:class 1 fructose-bisphosphatase n=1 Tax=Reichenbachiella agariperforans TaxID=156994 RepID=UPI001C0A3753|nr:class 1 fructose-bisphosphatase [Reichenbachiella agariperforans]MBU2888003.1 class 1 fructose-bisphosphatase [Gilvimarinus agarilyticus]MBU2915646.1 class 1 fructose-bisphosphatase [Reichenbachiella agariperforans]
MNNKTLVGSTIGTTLDRFINHKQADFPFATGELSQLLRDIALAGKIINLEINKSGLLDIAGAYGAVNVQGEEQQKLDVIANVRFIRALRNGGQVCAIVSEEDDEIVEINADSNYVVAMDPLDGSSNIDVNVSIGTIFSIYRRVTDPGEHVTKEDVLQKGDKQVAAGYILYGSSTMMVYTTGHGVNGFTLEPSLGEFVLSHADIQSPEDGQIYSVNEGAYYSFEQGVQDYIRYCKEERYSARYIGSLVSDFHRNMFKGGIYLYPRTDKSPNGKLRLVYECNALAFIAEQSGGMATDGENRIMSLDPLELHQRTQLLIGSTAMVKKAVSFL